MEWIDQNFEIDQRYGPKKMVSGIACGGVGIHHEYDDNFTISHITTGLRIMPVLVETMDEAKSYGARVLALGNWDFASPYEVDQAYYDGLKAGVIKIMADMRCAHHCRIEHT